MTATDLAVRDPPAAAAISAKIQYARALAESGLLPASYRKNPANVLWAMEYGEMLGLSPVATMTGVHVIDGKPTTNSASGATATAPPARSSAPTNPSTSSPSPGR